MANNHTYGTLHIAVPMANHGISNTCAEDTILHFVSKRGPSSCYNTIDLWCDNVHNTATTEIFQDMTMNSHIDGLVQDCSHSSVQVMELLQYCTEPLIYSILDEVEHSYNATPVKLAAKSFALIGTGNIKIIFLPYYLGSILLTWVSNYIHHKVWNEIAYPFSNFTSATVEVWNILVNFIPHFTGHLISYPWWD